MRATRRDKGVKRSVLVSKETRQRLSENNGRFWLGKKRSIEDRAKISKKLRGRHLSEETKRKISSSNTGKKRSVLVETRIKLSNAMKGRTHSKETRQKISEAHIGIHVGEKSPCWNPDREAMRRNQRNDAEYQQWVRRVKKRDMGICRLQSKNCMGYKVVHHILSWREYPEERYNINNGITLCQYHHPLKKDEERRLIPTFKELVGSDVELF